MSNNNNANTNKDNSNKNNGGNEKGFFAKHGTKLGIAAGLVAAGAGAYYFLSGKGTAEEAAEAAEAAASGLAKLLK